MAVGCARRTWASNRHGRAIDKDEFVARIGRLNEWIKLTLADGAGAANTVKTHKSHVEKLELAVEMSVVRACASEGDADSSP